MFKSCTASPPTASSFATELLRWWARPYCRAFISKRLGQITVLRQLAEHALATVGTIGQHVKTAAFFVSAQNPQHFHGQFRTRSIPAVITLGRLLVQVQAEQDRQAEGSLGPVVESARSRPIPPCYAPSSSPPCRVTRAEDQDASPAPNTFKPRLRAKVSSSAKKISPSSSQGASMSNTNNAR